MAQHAPHARADPHQFVFPGGRGRPRRHARRYRTGRQADVPDQFRALDQPRMSTPAAIHQIAAIEVQLARGDEAFRSAKIPGVFVRSLTRRGGAVYVATDAGLLQIGGSPDFAAPLWRQGDRYLYAFGPADHENVRKFATEMDRAFLPRPQLDQPAIAAGNRHPEISLPAVFDAFESILQTTGRNLASTVQLSATREMATDEEIAARDGSDPTAPGHTRVSIRHLYHAGLWAAIRAGYRHGYNAEADHFIVSGADDRAIARSVDWVKEAIRQAAGYTKFTTDTSRVFDLRADTRHPRPYSDAEIDHLFARRLTAEERAWVQDAFETVPLRRSPISLHARRDSPPCREIRPQPEAERRAFRRDFPREERRAVRFRAVARRSRNADHPARVDLLHALAARARPRRAARPAQSRLQKTPGLSGNQRRAGALHFTQNVAGAFLGR